MRGFLGKVVGQTLSGGEECFCVTVTNYDGGGLWGRRVGKKRRTFSDKVLKKVTNSKIKWD